MESNMKIVKSEKPDLVKWEEYDESILEFPKIQRRKNMTMIDSGQKEKQYWRTNHAFEIGNGKREDFIFVRFKKEFETHPAIVVNIQELDIDTHNNARIRVSADDVTREGFNLVFSTWSDTKVYKVGANWIAYA